jgi:hypothetical protein
MATAGILGPAVFDRHVLAFDVARFAQALAECGSPETRARLGRAAAEEPNHRHRRLLRAGSRVTTPPPYPRGA